VSAWLFEALGDERLSAATTEASRRLISDALALPASSIDDVDLRFAAEALELAVYEEMTSGESGQAGVTNVAARAFQLFRVVVPPSTEPLDVARWMLRTACLGILGDRVTDAIRYLTEVEWPALPTASETWGTRVEASVIDAWLRLVRKQGWDDLDLVQQRIATLRSDQEAYEGQFLGATTESDGVGRARVEAWRLVVLYHVARAVDVLGTYSTQGEVDGRYDVRQLLDAQFDRAVVASQRSDLFEEENMVRLLAATSGRLVDNNIWTVTRAVNSRVTQFVHGLVQNRPRPLIDMLPPQRRTLRERGLLGSSQRSAVVSLPTSSGKTLIAQFRILQALNQFDSEKGWVAYVAPTRALVNQITSRLRRDFEPLGIRVERVSPALEIDALESELLLGGEPDEQFRVLVTTPEKLDLMIRGAWEENIGRPLTLVVVDEAHNLAAPARGIKLELLLATINRECRNAQFLLLTPFIENAAEIASWLDPQSSLPIELELDWRPNDRAIVIAQPHRGERRGDFGLSFSTVHTSRETLDVPEDFSVFVGRPFDLTWSDVSGGFGSLAAAIASLLERRGATIILASRPDHTWPIAERLSRSGSPPIGSEGDLALVRNFIRREFGDDFVLDRYLATGIGVHHTGLSDEARGLTEWLFERGRLRALVATTTIAQGVNFPVESVIFASHQYPYGETMPPEDFWNIAGRAGRVDQGSVGLIALAATTEQRAGVLRTFAQRNVERLNSRLLGMLAEALQLGDELNLETLFYQEEWSAFLQYIAHTYREIGDPDQFSSEIEQVLRGTLGFQTLRAQDSSSALRLLDSVFRYAERLSGKPLALVDATGFSWESVSLTLRNVADEKLDAHVWSDDLFTGRSQALRQLMGVLLRVPEIRENLEDATGGRGPDGDFLASLIAAWVNGASLPSIAEDFFSRDAKGQPVEPTRAVTKACQNVFGKMSQTAAWGLAALQALTVGNFDELTEAEQRALRNLPSKVYYGVASDEAVALRVLGVPRSAAEPLARMLEVTPETAIADVRRGLLDADLPLWQAALGDSAVDYRSVWRILEGLSTE
jgi:superfamily II DNA/RNA helicase